MAERSLDELLRLTNFAALSFTVQTVAELNALPKGLLTPGQRVSVNENDTEYEWSGTTWVPTGGVTSVAGRTGAVTLGAADVSGVAPSIVDYTSSPDSVPSPTFFTNPDTRIRVGKNIWYSNGTRWLPEGGVAVIGRLTTPYLMTTAAEEMALSTTLYPWMLEVGDELKVDLMGVSAVAGTTGNRSVLARIGATGLSPNNSFGGATFNTTSRDARWYGGLKFTSNTTGVRSMSQAVGGFGSSTAPITTDVAFPDIKSANTIVGVVANTSVLAEPVTVVSAVVYLYAG